MEGAKISNQDSQISNASQEGENSSKMEKSSIENLNKEELLKLVKKQRMLLQKLKNKSDEEYASAQNKISILQKELEEVKEKEKEISRLEEELNDIKSERDRLFSYNKANEEQVYCLTMKLDTLQATCQCFQEELKNLQVSNKALKEDIKVLTDARDTVICSLKDQKKISDNQAKDLVKFSTGNEELLNNYKICIEEKLLLSSNNENLQMQIKNLNEENLKRMKEFDELKNNYKQIEIKCIEQEKENDLKANINDISVLLHDNASLRDNYEKLKHEYDQLLDKYKLFEVDTDRKISPQEDKTIFIKNEPLAFEDRQIYLSQKYMQEIENANSLLTKDKVKLEQEKSILLAEKENLSEELRTCLSKKNYLENEIDRLMKIIHDYEGYQTGFEHALLYGGLSNHLVLHETERSNECLKSEAITNNTTEVHAHNSEFNKLQDENNHLKHENFLLFKKIKTFTEAFKEYVPLIENSFEENINHMLKFIIIQDIDVKDHCKFSLNINETQNIENHLISLLQNLLEKEQNFKSLLKQIENEKHIFATKNSDLQHEIDLSNDKINSLSDELTSINLQHNEAIRLIENLEQENQNIKEHSRAIEKQNVELNEKLQSKCLEITEINFELELLIISIKQGVRQKTLNPYKPEREALENVSMLKLLFDDLNKKCNDYSLKIKNLQSSFDSLLSSKQNLEDELIQSKELNQFLEDEIQELREEIEQLKRENHTPLQKCTSHLYSIEEINELDDKNESLNESNIQLMPDNSNDDKIIKSKHIPFHLTNKPEYISTDHLDYKKDYDEISFKFNNLESECNLLKEENKNFILVINKFTEENSTLKSKLEEKSNLVEKIHFQIDELLTKNEEIALELQEKETDLKHLQVLNDNYKDKINKLEFFQNNIKTNLLLTKQHIKELKLNKTLLNSDIKSLNLSYQKNFSGLQTNLNCIIHNYFKTSDNLKINSGESSHSQNIMGTINSLLNEMAIDFDMLTKIFKNTIDKQNTACYDENEQYGCFNMLETKLHAQEKEFDEIQNKVNLYKNDSCCDVFKTIENLFLIKKEFLQIVNLHLQNLYENNIFKGFKNAVNRKMANVEQENHSKDKKIKELVSSTERNTSDNYIKRDEILEDGNSIDVLKTQLLETENKMNKCKQIALKLKKELAETKHLYNEALQKRDKLQNQVKEITQELDNMSSLHCQDVQNYQSLQNECDKIQDENEEQKIIISKLKEDLANTLHELNSNKEHKLELEADLKKHKQMFETTLLSQQEKDKKCIDLEDKIILLQIQVDDKVQKIKELEFEITKHLKEINNVNEENRNLKHQLEHAQKEGNKKNMLDLEIADYERSITELHNQVQKKDNKINELESELNCQLENIKSLQEEIKSTEMLKDTEEKRAANLKEILETTKMELASLKESKSELNNNINKIQKQLELLAQEEENYKLELSEAAAEIQKLKAINKTSVENHQRIVKSLDSKITSQKQEILIAHKEIERIKQDFENYKIRVHSVLKQQKGNNPPLTSVDNDLKEKLETLNVKLKNQVTDLKEKLRAMTLESETLQEEYDTVFQKYNKLIEEQEKKEAEWNLKLEQLNLEKNRLWNTQEEMSSQHLLQNEMLVATYKKQIRIMSEEHKRTVNELQNQLDAADKEIVRLQKDHLKMPSLPTTPVIQDNSIPFDILSQERQEGEGSESTDGTNTPIRHLSLATIPTTGFLSFEKLLQSPLEPGTPASFVSAQDSEKLLADLNTANKKIEHLTELLNDSESSNLRLSEQVRVLKEEVRRLERNKEREQHAENLEYLKNVLVKFATLQPCSEKAMLIPVLSTMLKLSPIEQQQLKNVAGEIVPSEDTVSGNTWGNYLHRWSGVI